jgi:hypothetical protein
MGRFIFVKHSLENKSVPFFLENVKQSQANQTSQQNYSELEIINENSLLLQ